MNCQLIFGRGVGRGQGEYTRDLVGRSHLTVDLPSLQSRDGARRVSAG